MNDQSLIYTQTYSDRPMTSDDWLSKNTAIQELIALAGQKLNCMASVTKEKNR